MKSVTLQEIVPETWVVPCAVSSAAWPEPGCVGAYVVRAARRQAVLDGARQLAALGLGGDLAGEGDAL